MKKLTYVGTILIGMAVALIAPAMAFAQTGPRPQFSVVGVENLQQTSAAIAVSFDSNGATYDWSVEPELSLNYTDPAGTTVNAGTVGESEGSRTTTFQLSSLTAGTTYTYVVDLAYGSDDFGSGQLTFTTPSPGSTTTSTTQSMPTGTPAFSLLGTAQATATDAAVEVSYDSQNASYDWTTEPKISISYTNTSDGSSYTTGAVGESVGSRTTTFDLNGLVSGTRYEYKAVMYYAGRRYESPVGYLTTTSSLTSSSSQVSNPTGVPSASVLGIVDLSTTEADISVGFNSQNASYEWESEPKVSVSYADLTDGTSYTSGSEGEAEGSRTTVIPLRNLNPGTKYSYSVVLSYAGNLWQTPPQTFTTKSSVSYAADTSTSDPTIGTATSTSSLFPSLSSLAATVGVTKVTSNAASILKTGGYGISNGVSLSVTDTHARVVKGDDIQYTIMYNNASTHALRAARIVVQLPPEYLYDTGDGQTAYDNSSNVVTVYLGSVDAGESGTATFSAKAIGTDDTGVQTKAELLYTGGNVSAADTDTYVGGSQSVLGASVFGAGFFPQTFFGWLLIIIILIILVIIARRYLNKKPPVPPVPPQNKP